MRVPAGGAGGRQAVSTPTATRLPLAEAEALAEAVAALLRPSCVRLEVAGSIRRRNPDVGDVELVAIPLVETERRVVDLFGTEEAEEVDRLHARCVALLEAGTFAHRPDKNGRASFGPKAKRLLYRGTALDLFCTTEEQFGVILLLRTGPAAFTQQMVLKRSLGGWLPRGLFWRDGHLWKLPAPYTADLAEHAWKIKTPTEESVFAAYGWPFVPPEQRGPARPPTAPRGG